MNILHIVGGSAGGGAARGALWLHQGLRQIGVDSNFLIQSGSLSNDNCFTMQQAKTGKVKQEILKQVDRLPTYLYQPSKKFNFSTGILGNRLRKSELYKTADIIHLHWINNATLSIAEIGKFDRPVVWTLRDMWPFTGGCHIALDCDQYKTGCGSCPALNSHSKLDITHWLARKKKKSFAHNIHPVAISNWLKNEARNSQVFSGKEVSVIHNCIDTDLFRPIEKKAARKILGLPENVKIILTGALYLESTYKGIEKFLDTKKRLEKKGYQYVFFGRVPKELANQMDNAFLSLGYLTDTVSLRLAYSAADVFVAPSLMEPFGKTLIEAMSCGTPVVCFDATGPKDIVTHKHDGYKATPFLSQSLAEGIEWVLHNALHSDLSANARETAVSRFSLRNIAEQYKTLYETII